MATARPRPARSPSAPGTPAASRARTSRSGTPWRTSALRLVRDGDRDADEGELELWTPALMQGYHHLPAKTAAVMTEDGYYRTGDVMRRDEHGFYYFVGRADDMFVCGGENIYPGRGRAHARAPPRHPAGARGAGVGRGARSEAGGLRRAGTRRDRHGRDGERLRARPRPGLCAPAPRGVGRRAAARRHGQGRPPAADRARGSARRRSGDRGERRIA